MKKIAALLLLLAGCRPAEQRLPILGEHSTETRTVNGQPVVDTVYHAIGPFSFVNQDSVTITNQTFDGKIYVADFFFTSCPTICPTMQSKMLKLYQAFKGNPDVKFLSYSIDPRHDTVPILKEYAQNLGAEGNQWEFVTGDKEKVYELAQKSYFVAATDDKAEPGGVVHSGAFVLVDKDKHIRGVYDGTKDEAVTQLMQDIPKLLAEYKEP